MASDTETALSKDNQEAFVQTARAAAQFGSALAIGVVIGLVLGWIQRLGRRP